MLIRYLAALAAVLILAACGGGGGGSPSTQDQAVEDRYRQELGGAPLNLSTTQIRSALQRRVNATDRMIFTDLLWAFGRRTGVTCSGAVCSVGGSDVTPQDFDTNEDYDALMTQNGVNLASTAERINHADGTSDYIASLIGWMNYNTFGVSLDVSADDAYVATDFFAYGGSLGTETGSNPVGGSATWLGVMTGLSLQNTATVQGAATLTADFAAGSIDVAFTNVHQFDLADETITRTADIRWNDVPFTENGFYARGAGIGDRIEGTFYGPGHAEAGGAFEHGNIVGAFGAKRQ